MGYIGNSSDNNVVTVTGVGATWNLSSILYIGNVGSFNTLTIANGASVTNVNGIIGNDPLAHNNRVRVTGNSSVWDSGSGDVFVGNSGYANSLTIDGGGQVFGGYGFIGTDPVTGVASNNSVRVSGSGSIWHNSADLYVGYFGSSNSLTIDSGGMVSNNFGFIGFDDGSFGSSSNKVLVTGAGSVWSNAADLVIGHGNGSSSNSLTIAAGGVVFNNYATIGKDFTANNNTVLVTGSGSIWTNSFDLYVGETGSFNSLTIASSGMVFSATGTIGSDANAHNNMAVVMGAGSSWINNGDLWIGWRGSYNSLIITSSGLVANANGYIGDGTNAGNNTVVVANGAVWSGGNLFVGNNGFDNSMVITNGGRVSYNNSYVGRTTFASNNSALVSGSGSIWTNSGEIRMGDFGSSNSLTIANSGVVVDGFGYIGAVDGASNNSALVSGSGSIWGSTNGFAVGYGGSFNSLVITNGGVVLNATTGGVGILSSAAFNSALISGSGSAWSNGSGLVVGYFGSGNQLTINNGGQMASGDSSIGGDAGATNNTALVTGSGSRWMVTVESGSLNVGEAGSFNSLTIANSGQVASVSGQIGSQAGASNNSVLVTGAGSVWSSSDRVTVGQGGAFNQLIITNGGTVLSSNGFIGFTSSASNNSALVSGAGSLWSNANNFSVGDAGPGARLTVSNNGTVTAPYMVAGSSTTSTGNYITVSGGNLYATNTAATGTLEIRRGTLTLNSGTVTVNQLVATNFASSSINFNGGTLNSGGGSINNGSLFRVGNGLSGATLHLVGGNHSFANGLFINTNAMLTGAGAITGAITVSGTIAPGDSTGIITGSGDLTLLSGALLQMHLAGTNAWLFDQINLAGALNFGGTLTVSLLDGFVPQVGDRFDLFDFSGTTGAFSQTNLPDLSGSLFWDTSLLYTSGEIFADSSSSAPVTNVINAVLVNYPGIYMVGTNGAGNGLIITNAGVLVSSAGVVGNSRISSNNYAWVTGAGSLWTNSGDLTVGATGSYNRLTIINTGIVMNSMGFIGYDASASNNSALVSGNGSIWSNTNGFGVGYSGSFNSLVITNGGVVINATTGGVGILPGANFNRVLISGSGSVWSNGSGFAMGLFGMGNQLTVNDGGRLVTSDASFGENAGANSNVVVVTDPNSIWRNSGDMTIGFATVGNQLIITNGGKVRVLGTFRLGTNSSLLNSAMLYVGGNFENASTNQAANNFSGTNIFNGSSVGGSWNIQNVEVASAFAKPGLGAATNFYFGTVLVGDAASGSNAWVRLVDNQINMVGGGNETFGASNVVVALAQSVLDLNNRTSFIWNLSNSGTILQTNSGPPGVVTRLDIVNTFTNAGTVLIGNGSVLQFSNAFVNAGVVELLAGGVLTNFVAGGVLTNNGSGSISGDGLIAALIRNDGIITATGGTLRLSAGFNDGTLGNPVNAGVLQALGGSANLQVEQSFTNTGTILASNAAAFTTTASAPVRNDNLIAIANQSTATFGAVVKNSGSGTIRVSNQSLLRFNAGLTNNGALVFGPAPNPSTAIITGTLMLGNNGIISMTYTNDTLVMRGNFINSSTNNMEFDTRYGMIVFGGTTPLSSLGAATNTFEVASTNRGPSFLGFNKNFSIGTLNITNHIEFVNNINNGGGLGTNEALYVDVLHLFDGATLKLSQLTIYVGIEFIYEDSNGTKVLRGGAGDAITESNKDSFGLVNVFLVNGGQIVFVPEPSSAALLLMGAGLAWSLRRRRARQR
ncbi:MAG: PEP-CTERM sorting domain-containing protein [Verrucomicrobia bacterium]|nr:PEP-CTERM sorting domain-containing protein [Verrucomicrobiota bacterium]